MNRKSFFGSQKGQSILESAISLIIMMVLVFGIIDLARLGFVVLHLNGAAHAASRSVAVGKGPYASAFFVMSMTEGATKNGVLISGGSVTKTKITGTTQSGFSDFGDSVAGGFGWKPLSQDQYKNVTVANGQLKYIFRPLFLSNPIWVLPIKGEYRTVVELPSNLPPY